MNLATLAAEVELVAVRHRTGEVTNDDRIVHHVFVVPGAKCECCGQAVLADIQVPEARDCLKGLYGHARFVKVRVYGGPVEEGWRPGWLATYKNHT